MTEEFKNSDIEILVATMNRSSLDFLVPMFADKHYCEFNILVINQTSENNIAQSDHPRVRVINVFDKGLSKSRNLALDNAIGRLCIITDDDVVFKADFCKHIIVAFNENRAAAVISFRVEKAEGVLYKKYPLHRLTTTKLSNRLNIMSIEMVVNLEKVRNAKLQFNEHFGLGAQFCMGEEAIFLNDAIKLGLCLVIEPQVIAMHSAQDTHERIGVWDKYFVQGALFTALLNDKYYLLVVSKIAYEIMRSKIKLKQVRVAIKAVAAGRAAFKQII